MARSGAIFVPGERANRGLALAQASAIQFHGTVPAMMRGVVEDLFFFNAKQKLLIQQIETMVEMTGVPFIAERDERIWIDVPSGSMQCLFACHGTTRPIGVLLYGRPDPDLLRISHLAVDPEYDPGDNGGPGMAGIMVNKLQEIARSIHGITRIELPYRRGRFLSVRSQR